ncbi:LuxR C-terminal-related transcriptional regulator [Desulfovibrio sp. OttesenSCG-928-C14]|nr:LuxR C-terminal-related transcriptional regulator [Desulfovibrio sp. OttesenSCG-928-C14]
MYPPLLKTSALYFSERLMRDLGAIHSYPLSLIEAPMGYGKTLAVREYLRRKNGRVIWATVPGRLEGEGYDTAEAFWKVFCRVLAKACPDKADSVEALLRLGYPHDAVRVEAAQGLISGLDFSPDSVLVIDDVHFLPEYSGPGTAEPPKAPGAAAGTGPNASENAEGRGESAGIGALCELLALAEDSPHIVMISRHSYAGRRAMLQLKGLLAVVGQESFALGPEEIREYYSLCGVRLNAADALLLQQATGGWISGLYLYLLHYSKSGALGRPPALSQLLEKEVFAALGQKARDLLLRLSPLERFNAEQAAFLYGPGAGEALDELLAKNAFISHDESGKTYAIHAIFREYLKGLFDSLPQGERAEILSRCADWCVERGEAAGAMEYCYRAGDFERALRIFDNDVSRTRATEHANFFMEFFRACPLELLAKYPGAAFRSTLLAFSTRDYRLFSERLAWLEKHCAALPDGDEVRSLRGELEFLRSFTAFNDIRGMSVHHRRAYEFLQGKSRFFGVEPWSLGAPSVLFMYHREQGTLEREVRDMFECLEVYYRISGMHGAGGEYLMRADALFNAGEFEEAAITCHQAWAMAREHGQLCNEICALFLQMRLALAGGELEKAEDFLREMRALVTSGRIFSLLATVDLCKGFLYAHLERIEDVPPWLCRADGLDKHLYAFAGGSSYVVRGRALLASKSYTALIGLFSWLLQSGQFADKTLLAIYAHLYIAAASAALGRAEQAEQALASALDMALPDRLFMPFAENYALLESAMKALARREAFRQGIAAIRRLGQAWEKNRKQILLKRFNPGQTPLTGRELELARLSVSGLKYREIAERLHLAPSTVKKAFTVIYRKLGVNTRSELREHLNSQG